MNWFLEFVFLFSYFSSTFSTSCPEGTVQSLTDKTICYLFNPTKLAYLNAEQICVQNNGHLVSIHDMFENVFVQEQAQLNFTESTESDFWIGITDLLSGDTWTWIDGSIVDFVDWEKGQPVKMVDFDCGASNLQSGKWSADLCEKSKPFVCKIKRISNPTTIVPLKTTTSPKPQNCQDSWTFYGETNSCYKILHNLSWHDAEIACFSEGAHLASIHSLNENNFITNLINFNPNDLSCDVANFAWIGLYTVDKQATWQWTDDSPYNFTAWASSRPSGPNGGYCTLIWNGPRCQSTFGTWGDGGCPAKIGFSVCKKSVFT